jgi:LPXTG-motif cell wall-anchored protein
MRVIKSLAIVFCLGVLVLSVPVSLKADEWNKETRMTFNQPVEIPGMVLTPGTYVFKLLDSASDRNVVQIFNGDESRFYENVLAIPAYRAEPTDKTVVTFEERSKGTPEAIKDWFYPGDNAGQEFVYPGAGITQAASLWPQKSTSEKVYSTPPATTQHQASAPATLPRKSAVASPPPQNEHVQIAQTTTQPKPAATSAAPAQVQKQTPKKLPKTASQVPFLVLIGLLSIAGSAGLHVFSKRTT